MYKELSRELLDFLKASPSSFHAVHNIAQQLNDEGYISFSSKQRKHVNLFVIRVSVIYLAVHVNCHAGNHRKCVRML